MSKFEDLIAWQKAQDLAIDIYDSMHNTNDSFLKEKICDAAVAISTHIAAGLETNSNDEFCKYLGLSLKSVSSVKSLVYISVRLQYIDNNVKIKLLKDADEIAVIIQDLIKSLSTS